jgi:threonine synthase
LTTLENQRDPLAVTNEEILDAQRLLAKTEGIFAEPSGVTSLAGLVKELSTNGVEKSETIVVEITGNGLKDPNIAIKGMPEIPVIDASIKQLERVLTV